MIALVINILEILKSQSLLFFYIIISGVLFFWFISKLKKKSLSDKKSEENEHIQYLIKTIKLLAKDSYIDIFMFDEYERIIYVFENDRFIKTDLNFSELERNMHPDDKQRYYEDYADITNCRKDTVLSLTRIYDQKEKKYKHYEFVIVPVRKDAEGKVSRYIYSRKDVTKSRELLDIRERNIKSFNLALKSAKLIRWQYDYEHRKLKFINSDYKEYEVRFEEINEIICEEDLEKFLGYIRCIEEFKEPESIIIKLKIKGQEIAYEINSLLYKKDNTTFIYGIMKDVSQFLHYQKQITELKDNMALALEAGDISVWRYEIKTSMFHYIYGSSLNSKEISYKSFEKYLHPGDVKLFENGFRELISGVREKVAIKYRMLINNEWHWFLSSVIAVANNNRIIALTGTRKNITEDVNAKILLEDANRKLYRSNEEISYNEQRLQYILDKIPVPIYIKDPETQEHVYINEEAQKVYNLKLNSVTDDVVESEDSQRHRLIDEEMMKTGEEYMSTESYTLKSGERIETYVRKIIIEQNYKKLILVARLNLTEQKKAVIANKILSASISSLKAYTWSFDNINNQIIYRDIYLKTKDRNINDLNSLEKKLSLIHKEDRKNYADTINKYIEAGVGNFSVTYRSDIENAKQYKWWESRCVVETIYTNDLSYVYIYGIDINIDNQKRNELSLKKSRKKLKAVINKNELILNNNASAMIYLNSEFKVQWSNAHLIFKKEDLSKLYTPGVYCYEIKGKDEPCLNCPAKRALVTGHICTEEMQLNDDFYEVIAIPILNESENEGVVLRIDKVTERKLLIEDLQNAKTQAEESEKLKMSFLANMSHEIRTPLNAIIGFSELMMYDEYAKEREEYMNIIKSNSNLLLGLINDILDMSKIESGAIKFSIERFDISTLFNEIYIASQQQCNNPDVKLIANNRVQSCIVSQDKNRISQIFGNFISNAIKYTSSGHIIIAMENIDNGIRISVKDTGIGIDRSLHHQIFRRFEKLDSYAPGTGLGLAICKSIIDAIGGKIGFDSEKNAGSLFWAWFPMEFRNKRSKTKNQLLLMDEKGV